MNRLLILMTFVVAVCGSSALAQTNMNPPVAKKVPYKTKIHGYDRVDNYHWMRDRNNPRSPEIIQHLEAENAYTTAKTAHLGGLRDTLYDEMLGRIKQDDSSVPTQNGKYWYWSETVEGKQYPVYLRSKTATKSDREVVFDQNALAVGHKYFGFGDMEYSDDGNLVAFTTDTIGYRQYTLHFKDLRTGKTLADSIERVTSVAWANDNKTVFFVTEDEEDKRSDKMWRYAVGSNKPELIYEEKDVLFSIGTYKTLDDAMIMLTSGAATMTEYRYIPADKIDAKWQVIIPRSKDHEYSVDHWGNDFYIRTNKNAENFRVVKAPVSDPSEKNWKDFIPSNPKVKVEGTQFFKSFAVVAEVENGLEYLKIFDLKNKQPAYRIPTDEEVYTLGLAGNRVFDTETIRYSYASMITPTSTYEYNLKTRAAKIIKQQEIPSGYDKSKYETKRLWATARDGVKVPLSVLMKKGTKLDGKAAMLLYAYGSYGYSMSADFSTTRLSLVDRGMIYVIAHIRGGSELGEQWRQEGRMMKKMNTFNDFVDSAKWLIGEKYTSPERLVIQGGSAGGLLMGAVVNQSPQTFKAAIVQVPFVDVLNTMLDESLPLTTGEWIEWGNPNEKEAYDYMAKYSPYDNIIKQKYPNMLVEISLYDSQVLYWEGAKYAAKVREYNQGDSTVLLKTNMSAGHGGASGRYDRLKEIAFDYAYALDEVGIEK